MGGSWHGGHDEGDSASVGMVEWAGVIFAEPGVQKGVRAINLVCLGEEEPEMPERFPRDEFKLGRCVRIGSGASEVGQQGKVRGFSRLG